MSPEALNRYLESKATKPSFRAKNKTSKTLESYTCEHCDPPMVFTGRNTYLKHCHEAHGVNGLKCEHCEMTFHTVSNYCRHKAKMHYYGTFKCLACNKTCRSAVEIVEHMEDGGGEHEGVDEGVVGKALLDLR